MSLDFFGMGPNTHHSAVSAPEDDIGLHVVIGASENDTLFTELPVDDELVVVGGREPDDDIFECHAKMDIDRGHSFALWFSLGWSFLSVSRVWLSRGIGGCGTSSTPHRNSRMVKLDTLYYNIAWMSSTSVGL